MGIHGKQLLVWYLAATVLGCSSPAADTPPEPRESEPTAATTQTERTAPLETGFLVWESNRSGRWRLWIRDLDGGEPRQLTPDDGRNLHCCPHISPAGDRIVYLTLGPDQDGYPQGGAVGAMNWIRPDGSGVETLLPAARNYYENRAAVWRASSKLIYIRQDGRTAQLDLETRESSLLITEPDPLGPWLINSELTWAASGNGALAPYLRQRKSVASRPPKPGCQPYFSNDGRWGFWVVAPGGPIDRLELSSETRSTWLRKSDPRMPEDFGYLYFPMLSSDGRLLAFAASDEDHPHFEADYEIFIAATDPTSLELLGNPQRFTHHPATDRFPDVYLAPLPLGRHFGEAPFAWTADPGEPQVNWRWEFGDGDSSTGPVGEHVFETPGKFSVVARTARQSLTGQVSVSPAAPPQILSSRLLNNGTELVVAFDEAIEISQMIAKLESGTAISRHTLELDNRRLVLFLQSPVQNADSLHLAGVTDRARVPNAIGTVQLEIQPPLWPATREHLEFLWQTGNAPNLLFNPRLGAETAVTLTPRGTARLDHDFAMRPAGGRFEVPDTASHRICLECKRTYEISLEMVLTPAPHQTRRGVILTSASKSRRNFSVEQQKQGLHLGLRMKSRGEESFPRVFLVDLPPSRQSHVVITYGPGELKTYLDGQLVTSDPSISGGFFHWRPAPLVFGSDWNGRDPWHGTLEGVAVYSRRLTADQARESYTRYRVQLESRRKIPAWTVKASLLSCSQVPTLKMIDPYREALVTCRYRVEKVLDGGEMNAEITVADWSIMDGQLLDLAPAGTTSELRLTLLEDNLQLASVYLSDTLEPPVEGSLFYLDMP